LPESRIAFEPPVPTTEGSIHEPEAQAAMSSAATTSTESPWSAWPALSVPDDSASEERAAAEEPVAACAPQLDDAQLAGLVLRVCDQHEPSLARLYEATSARVHGLVLRIVRLAPLAEEVVEDVFWQVWREAPRFDAGRGRVLAWLLAIARSRAIDALRRNERVRASEVPVDDDDTLDALADGHEHSGDPFDLVGAAQHHVQLHALLAGLEPLPRQLLALAFMRGFTHEEIAEQTGLALGTIKSHIRRTLVALRSQLADAASSLETS
jgi:RNA polymerase sigma factor (sigma-70 family)